MDCAVLSFLERKWLMWKKLYVSQWRYQRGAGMFSAASNNFSIATVKAWVVLKKAFFRSSHRRCSIKQGIQKFSKIHRKTPVLQETSGRTASESLTGLVCIKVTCLPWTNSFLITLANGCLKIIFSKLNYLP